MRTLLLVSLLLILPWQQLGAQDAPQVEDALPADPDVEPEIILEPPDGASDATADSESSDEASDRDAGEEADIADVPGRVARLSLIEGDVSIAPAGTEELTEAVLNRPLTSGDRVLVDSGGRAELQIGNATIYLDGGSGLSLVELSDGALRASLTEGTAVIRVRRKQADEIFEVATPTTTVELLRPGEYSVEVDPDGKLTQVHTRSGEAEVTAGDGEPYVLSAKQQGKFTGAEKLTARINELGERTEFESFANDRERRDLESRSAKYVSRDVIGYEDLDEHGEWIEEPEYGHVWRPRLVDTNWVPYRYGRWAFIAPWGWTWIDHARWGFAPFHYGRWAYSRSRWCWVPGPRRLRPIYAPALVGWTGRSTLNVSIAFGGGVGWFPLAPREIFVPHYRYSRRYARNVNISNTIIINNNTTFINNIYRSGGRQGWGNGRQSAFLDYRYRKQASAVTLVQRDVFIGGRNIDGRFRRLDERQWQRARHDGVPPSIDPQRSSLLAGRPIQRTGWQQRFARAERAFGPPRPAGLNGGSTRRQADVSNATRGQRWQDRGSLPRTPTNGFAPGQRRPDQGEVRRWQGGGQQSEVDRQRRERAQENRRSGGDQSQPRRWQDRRSDEQAERRPWQQGSAQAQPRRWQDRRSDEQSEPGRGPQGDQIESRRRQDRGADRPERRWQERRGDGQSEPRPTQGGGAPGERRWQDRGGDQQPDQRRWQDRGGQREQRREEPPPQRWQDRGQRPQPQPQPEQRREERKRDEGRGGWQQRSNDNREQRSRGNGGQPRWQRQ
jgi:hypothetical protein